LVFHQHLTQAMGHLAVQSCTRNRQDFCTHVCILYAKYLKVNMANMNETRLTNYFCMQKIRLYKGVSFS
jgi:hypothetical protein